MTILTYVMRRKHFARIKKTINSVVQPVTNLFIKKWPKRWLPRRPIWRGLIRLRAKFRYQPLPPLPASVLYRVVRRKIRPRKLIARFFRPKAPRLVLGVILTLFKPLRRLRMLRRKAFIARKRMTLPPKPASFVAVNPRRRIRIKRARIKLFRKIFIPLVSLLLFKPARRIKFKRAKLRFKPRNYSFGTIVAGLVIKRWPKRWLPRRPMRRGLIRMPWRVRSPNPVQPATVIYRNIQRRPPWKRKLMRRLFWKLRLQYVIGSGIVQKVVDWLVTARRRGRR